MPQEDAVGQKGSLARWPPSKPLAMPGTRDAGVERMSRRKRLWRYTPPPLALFGTNKVVIEFRKSNPCATLETIGHKAGISRERVRQILKLAALPTRHIQVKKLFQCLNCEQSFPLGRFRKERKYDKYDHQLFCSISCSKKYHTLTLTCETCGVIFQRGEPSVMNNVRGGYGNHFFCSKSCQGKWAAKNFGFVAHPENGSRKYGENRKWDYKQIWELRSQGLKLREIMDRLSIPQCSLNNILYCHKAEHQDWREARATNDLKVLTKVLTLYKIGI